MNIQHILVRFGEMTLKGRNRHRFEAQMYNHIRYVLVDYPDILIEKSYGRMFFQLNGAPYIEISPLLQNIFGIINFSPVLKVDIELEAIRAGALQMMRSLPNPPQTFKVNVRRPNKSFPYDSQQMNRLVGGYVLSHMNNLQVDVHRPQVELSVEIREDAAYIYCEVVPGLGGYPLGSSGKAVLMLSGGIDSPVAGWLAMRKGLIVEAVHFHSFPYTSERSQEKVVSLVRQLSKYVKHIRLHMVPFTDIQMKLKQHARSNLLMTHMRRTMLKITEQIAHEREAGAVITGESLGQVASQTLPSMNVIGKVAELPLIRPLITMDKQEIIRIAEQIGTFEISIQPYEDCCTLFVPKSPSTNPNLRIVETMEEQMEWLPEAIATAVANTETILISTREQQKTDDWF